MGEIESEEVRHTHDKNTQEERLQPSFKHSQPLEVKFRDDIGWLRRTMDGP